MNAIANRPLAPVLLALLGLALTSVVNTAQTPARAQQGRDWYVAPNGTAGNDGSLARPIDIATAFAGSRVKPGDTVLLRGGTYRGPLSSQLTGTAGAPITVRSYPGEQATIADDRYMTTKGGTVNVQGAWTIYRDFAVTNINENRGHTNERRPMGFEVQAPNTKFIDLVVYDTGMGFGFWKEAVDAELYGNLIFNGGSENTPSDFRHGHAIYTQNEQGTKLIKDNVIVNEFGFGIHAYPNPGGLVGFRIEGNVIADSGAGNPESSGFTRNNNILVDGYDHYSIDRVEVVGNFTYHSPREKLRGRYNDANVCFGCANPNTHKRVSVTDNYFAGGQPVLVMAGFQNVTMRRNTFVSSDGMASVVPAQDASLKNWDWDQNTYIGSGPRNTPLMFGFKAQPLAFADWVKQTGFDRSSTYVAGTPTGTKVFIRPNQYEPGRANVVVYNWDRTETVNVDLGAVLKSGAKYEVRNAMDFFGRPVAAGTFDGAPVRLPMRGLGRAAPRGLRGNPSSNRGEFAVFVVLPAEAAAAATPVPGSTTSQAPLAAPPPQVADAVPGRDPRQMLVGRYFTKDGRGEIRIDQSGARLSVTMVTEKGAPSYPLTEVSPTRFRLENTPPGVFARFDVSGGQVRSLTIERGILGNVTVYPK